LALDVVLASIRQMLVKWRSKVSMSVTYGGGARSAREVQEIVDTLLESVDTDAELIDDIQRLGANPTVLTLESITVEEDSSGLDPVSVSLIITFGAQPIIDIWRRVLLPRIQRRWGIDTVGDESDETDEKRSH
jgi:hypothetical protein